MPGAALRQVSLLVGDTTLELLEYRSPPSETDEPLRSNSLGASHVAFLVEDIEATKAELEAKGIEFYSPVNIVDEGVLAGWRWVYFEDPDGYPLELVEVAYYHEEDRRAASRRISRRGHSAAASGSWAPPSLRATTTRTSPSWLVERETVGARAIES